MINSTQTQVSFFILGAYFDAKQLRYLFFLVVLLLYVLIVSSNLLLIAVICVNRSLRQPMYLFLCSLFVNEMYGSSALFPFLLVQILSDVHTVSAPLCFGQIFCVHSYFTVEFLNLFAMSYDRYLAICFPLQYRSLMSVGRFASLTAAVWLTSFVGILSLTCLSVTLRLCGNVINKLYCSNYSIVTLACSDTTLNNIVGLVCSTLVSVVPVIIIVYTYGKILKVCYCGSAQTRQKAVSTCLPQLASLLNYTVGACFEIVQSRFNMSNVPSGMRMWLSLYFVIFPPLLNPLMFGLNLSNVRRACKHLFSPQNLSR